MHTVIALWITRYWREFHIEVEKIEKELPPEKQDITRAIRQLLKEMSYDIRYLKGIDPIQSQPCEIRYIERSTNAREEKERAGTTTQEKE